MKTSVTMTRLFYALTATTIFASCQKNSVEQNESTTTAENTIAVAATASTTTGTADSVYLLQSCGRGGRRDSIPQSALPASAQTYISANYAGATFSKAFAVKSSSGTITNYVAVVYYNNAAVGLLFDAAGTFVRVLEQRERGDLNGAGHHRGGRFEHRDGQGRDTVALSALPLAVKSYFAANYGGDTLVKAFRTKDSSLVVLSRNNGAFATVFSSSNVFVKREQLHTRAGNAQSVELAALPSAAASYLAQTYPNYVFQKAFAILQSGVVKGYVVFIDANTTKYAVEFDAAGVFVRAKTIH